MLRIHGENHSGHPAHLEFTLLNALYKAGLQVPEPVLWDDSAQVLSQPFLVTTMMSGTDEVQAEPKIHHIDTMAIELARIHTLSTKGLPDLPERRDPLPELLDYVPPDPKWQPLLQYLAGLDDTGYSGEDCLLHGDFWPGNLLWQSGKISAILDWEDAAIGDPLSDVACTCLELRYLYGQKGMTRFADQYAQHLTIDRKRLALWQIYVAAAAQKYMGLWRLDADRENHMREQAFQAITESFDQLKNMSSVGQ